MSAPMAAALVDVLERHKDGQERHHSHNAQAQG
jgi:hypothetical protein